MELKEQKDPFRNPSDEQVSLIGDFRAAFNDHENAKMSDYDCIRFLMAREWSTEEAVKMKQNDFRVRRNLQTELMCSKSPHPIVKAIAKLRRAGINHNCYGKDKNGDPVCYSFQGAFISLPLYKYISTQQYMDWLRNNFEAVKTYELTPSGAPRILAVVDLEDLSLMTRHNGKFTNAAILFNVAHSPEYTSQVLCVNAPKLVSGLWALIKPLMPERTTKKISFYDKASTPSILAEHIDKEYLPKMYGGEVDDEKCFTPHMNAEEIESALSELKHLRDENAKRDNAKTLELAAGEMKTVSIECKAHSLVTWWFLVRSYNVIFSVRWKPRQDEWIEIREPQQLGDEEVGGHRFPIHSDYLVDSYGTMEFKFSNEHSKFRGKTISYDIQVQGGFQ